MNFGKIISSMAKMDNSLGRGVQKVAHEADMMNYRKLVNNGEIREVDRLYPRVESTSRGWNPDKTVNRVRDLQTELDRAISVAKETGDYSSFNKVMKEKMYMDKQLSPKQRTSLYPETNNDIPF